MEPDKGLLADHRATNPLGLCDEEMKTLRRGFALFAVMESVAFAAAIAFYFAYK